MSFAWFVFGLGRLGRESGSYTMCKGYGDSEVRLLLNP